MARDISRLYPTKSAKLTGYIIPLDQKYPGYTTVRPFDARCQSGILFYIYLLDGKTVTVHLNVSELLLHVITPAMLSVTWRVYSGPLIGCTELLFDFHVVKQFL